MYPVHWHIASVLIMNTDIQPSGCFHPVPASISIIKSDRQNHVDVDLYTPASIFENIKNIINYFQ